MLVKVALCENVWWDEAALTREEGRKSQGDSSVSSYVSVLPAHLFRAELQPDTKLRKKIIYCT